MKRRWMIVKTLGAAISLGAGAVGRSRGTDRADRRLDRLVRGAARCRLESRLKLLVACGAAAGIATTFNAPIGSVMFAQEIVLQGKVELAHFSLIVISTATAVIASRALGGAATVFHTADLRAPLLLARSSPTALMGLALGVAGRGYVRFFHATIERVATRCASGRRRSSSAGSCWSDSSACSCRRTSPDGYPVIQEALAGKLAGHRSC